MITQVDSLRGMGIKIGINVHIDAEWPGETGVSIEDGAVIERGSLLYGHWLIFDGMLHRTKFVPLKVGAHACIGARAALMPGVNVPAGQAIAPAALKMAL